MGIYEILNVYWIAYGRWKALVSSPYLHFAILFASLFCFPVWRFGAKWIWFDAAINVLPSMLGFTLGGYAMLLAVGDDKFRRKIAGKKEDETASPFMEVNAAFVHFILMQAFALMFALIGKSWCLKTGIPALIGLSIFIYALSTSIAAAFAIFRMASWYDEKIKIDRENEANDKSNNQKAPP